MILRRLGLDPHADNQAAPACFGSPGLSDFEHGDFAVIGVDFTDEADPHLPPTAGRGPDERMVRVPGRVPVGAKSNLPAALLQGFLSSQRVRLRDCLTRFLANERSFRARVARIFHHSEKDPQNPTGA